MRYTYVGIDARRFTYQFLGELFRVRHIWRVTWKAVNYTISKIMRCINGTLHSTFSRLIALLLCYIVPRYVLKGYYSRIHLFSPLKLIHHIGRFDGMSLQNASVLVIVMNVVQNLAH